jgi:hypothetical protein
VESSCELGNELRVPLNAGNYRVAAQLVASRAVLSSTELVITELIVPAPDDDVECELRGMLCRDTEILGEHLPQCRFVHHISDT